jgi:hypothetical protein
MCNRQIESDWSNCGHWTRNMFESSGAENQVINSDLLTKKRTNGYS